MPDRTPEPSPVTPAAVGLSRQGVWLTERLGAARTGFHLSRRITFERVDAAARIRTSHGVDVEFDVFFDTPHATGLAEAVKEQL
ncbi:hypothetical protein [Kitasatospora sp. NPDC087315]|uniref:hypothetical protein n=1 Tax=Kitasatospora sp. NPDC087315 TaxID=3364069 RepID=UPI0037F56E50